MMNVCLCRKALKLRKLLCLLMGFVLIWEFVIMFIQVINCMFEVELMCKTTEADDVFVHADYIGTDVLVHANDSYLLRLRL